ncbi:uncharacterized protein PAC_06023 [Phialocephala subalpina]|uniref:Integral membrane protein n=1 Tax=Phialocephala subalpina TaxID=576137 RepID=A0A1L7WTM1_9HELO|nr:uncharacterized protein PAC_06023 [Phialocephala subalpina]
MLAGMLASMSNKNLDIFGANTANLDIFDVNTANLSISSSSLANLGNLARRAATSSDRSSGLTNEALTNATSSSSSSINITASDLELADLYKVSLWNYCGITGSNITCTNAKFDWALSSLDTSKIESTATSLIGVNVTLPLEVKSALKTFAKVAKWIEVVYIIATITTFVELVIGLFATCSRAGSYGTIIISGLSTASIIVASIMVTAVPSTVVGAINSVGKAYGVKASLNTSYLAITWMAVAFSLASSFFWTFRICCSADHSIRKSSSGSPWRRNSDIADAEKMIPSSGYQRVYNPNETSYTGQQYDLYNPRTGMQTQQEYGVPIDGGGVGITEDRWYEGA